MVTCNPVFDELVSQIANQTFSGTDGARMVPVMDHETGLPDGLLAETFLERVMIFSRKEEVLSLSDVGRLRRAMARVQARRALLYVPVETFISNPVMLLATLSKIRIVRLTANQS